MREQECRILLDTWGARTADSPALGRKEADRLLREVELLGGPPVLRARALAISGSSWRALGKLDLAHECYNEAFRLYEQLRCKERQLALDEGDLLRRLALLHFTEGKPVEAAKVIHQAVLIFQGAEADHLLGLALTAQGIIEIELKQPSAIETLSRAVLLVDPVVSLPAHLAAIHNLVIALSAFEPEAQLLEECLAMVNDLRLSPRSRRPSRAQRQRQPLGRRLKTLPDAMARALLGRLHNLLGQHHEGRRLLESAREDLAELGALSYQAAVCIELAECWLWTTSPRQWQRVEALVTEACSLGVLLPKDDQERAAVAMLSVGVAKLSRRRLQEQLKICRRLVLRGNATAGLHS